MLTIGDLPASDAAAAHRLAQQAFGDTSPHDPGRPGVGAGRLVAAHLDGALVGQVRRHGFGQHFGGRRLACAGISGVAVAPEARGRGLARRMLAETFDRAVADGEVVAALYPTTAALYRSVGFEVAGWWAQRAVPLGELPADDGSLTWERAELGDGRLVEVYDRMAVDRDGWLDPPEDFWTWRAMAARSDERTNRYCYLGRRDGEVVAAVQYAYGSSERAMFRVDAEHVVGIDGPAVRGALAFLAGNGTTAEEVRTVLPAGELALHLDHLQRTRVVSDWPWMLAFVDLPGAIAARGYPVGVAGSVVLAVDDPVLPANAGRWVLTVEDGTAVLEPAGGATSGGVAVTARDLASVFSGQVDPMRLARAGRLGDPSPAELGLLRATFVGDPSLPTFF